MKFIIALLLSLFMASSPATYSDQYITEPDAPLTIELKTNLASDISHEGDLFEGILVEDTYYQSVKLPARTKFLGHIAKVKNGRRFHRKGYLALNVDEVIFPEGESLHFIADAPDSAEKKLKAESDPANKNKKYITIPLSIIGFVAPLPIAIGVRAAVGTVTGLTNKNTKNESLGKRIGKGLYNVTPIPTVVNLVKKQPEVEFQSGDQIQLYLPETMMSALFPTPNNGEMQSI